MSTIDAQSHVARIDVLKDLSKMTLDVIGLAGMIHLASPEYSMADISQVSITTLTRSTLRASLTS